MITLSSHWLSSQLGKKKKRSLQKIIFKCLNIETLVNIKYHPSNLWLWVKVIFMTILVSFLYMCQLGLISSQLWRLIKVFTNKSHIILEKMQFLYFRDSRKCFIFSFVSYDKISVVPRQALCLVVYYYLREKKATVVQGSSDSANLSPELRCDSHSVEYPKTSWSLCENWSYFSALSYKADGQNYLS